LYPYNLNLLRKRFYTDSYKDSNLLVNINDSIIGYLTHRKVDYKLYVPLKIYDSTTTIINNKIPILPKYQLKVGLTVNPRGLAPNVDLSIKRNTYSISYDPFNKIPYIGYKYTIWYSKDK